MKNYLAIKPQIRHPVVAGYFYPADPDELVKIIEESFRHPLGPGKIPKTAETRTPSSIGFISPHAGYMYSGPIATHVFYKLAEEGKPDTVIILGTNHTGLGSLVSVYPAGKWITPLGELEVDHELARSIVNNSSLAELDTYAHIEEHSIEVQLPFLQYIYGNDVKIVPIVIGLHTPDVARDLSHSIFDAVSSLHRDVVIIASSDFNHYDPYEITLKKDHKAIERILTLDTDGFYKIILEEHITVCGPGAIMTLIEYTKTTAGVKSRAELLKHATSGDISGDKATVVGYAAIRFYSE